MLESSGIGMELTGGQMTVNGGFLIAWHVGSV